MPNNHFTSGAANREGVQERREEADPISPIRMSMPKIAEQKLNQLGCYIRGAYGCDEDGKGPKERTRN